MNDTLEHTPCEWYERWDDVSQNLDQVVSPNTRGSLLAKSLKRFRILGQTLSECIRTYRALVANPLTRPARPLFAKEDPMTMFIPRPTVFDTDLLNGDCVRLRYLMRAAFAEARELIGIVDNLFQDASIVVPHYQCRIFDNWWGRITIVEMKNLQQDYDALGYPKLATVIEDRMKAGWRVTRIPREDEILGTSPPYSRSETGTRRKVQSKHPTEDEDYVDWVEEWRLDTNPPFTQGFHWATRLDYEPQLQEGSWAEFHETLSISNQD